MHWSPGNIGFYFLVLGVFDMFTQGYLVGKLLPKFGTLNFASKPTITIVDFLVPYRRSLGFKKNEEASEAKKNKVLRRA